jgi:hypothetical protein
MSHKPAATPAFESASPDKNPTCWRLSTHMYPTATGAFMPSARIIDAPVHHHPPHMIQSHHHQASKQSRVLRNEVPSSECNSSSIPSYVKCRAG